MSSSLQTDCLKSFKFTFIFLVIINYVPKNLPFTIKIKIRAYFYFKSSFYYIFETLFRRIFKAFFN